MFMCQEMWKYTLKHFILLIKNHFSLERPPVIIFFHLHPSSSFLLYLNPSFCPPQAISAVMGIKNQTGNILSGAEHRRLFIGRIRWLGASGFLVDEEKRQEKKLLRFLESLKELLKKSVKRRAFSRNIRHGEMFSYRSTLVLWKGKMNRFLDFLPMQRDFHCQLSSCSDTNKMYNSFSIWWRWKMSEKKGRFDARKIGRS